MNTEQRFWMKVDPCRTDGCYVYIGTLDEGGYGRFRHDGRDGALAHHYLVGRPARGLEWDHLCRNHACVNPSHLELVTHAVNVQRGIGTKVAAVIKTSRTHCAKGHAYNEANTHHYKGWRVCRACIQERRPTNGTRLTRYGRPAAVYRLT